MRTPTCGVAAVFALLATVQPVFAQIPVEGPADALKRPTVQKVLGASRATSPVSITGSFQGVTDVGGGRSNGWVFGARLMLTKWLGVEAELNGAYGGSDFSPTSWRDHSLLGGVRVSGTRRLAPFARVQAGMIHSAFESWTSSGFVIQPGGGLEMLVNRHFGVSAAVDVQISRVYLAQTRFTMGAVVPLGR